LETKHRFSKILLFFCMGLFLNPCGIAQAQVVKIPLKWQDSSPLKPTSLSGQKKSENEKKWSDCHRLAKSNLKKYPTVRAWVMTSMLRCSRGLATDSKNPASLLATLHLLDKDPEMLLQGAAKYVLMKEMIRSRLLAVDLLRKKMPWADSTKKLSRTQASVRETGTVDLWTQIDALQSVRDRLDRAQKAQILSVAGELSQAQGQLKAARFLYEQSLAELELRAVRDKLNSVLFSLNEKPAIGEKNSREPTEALTLAEGTMEERLKVTGKSGDPLLLLEDCLLYLNQFPSGRRASWAQDKVLEIYNGVLDRSKDDKWASVRDRALKVMATADPLRLSEWARILHRRADYVGSQRMAEAALTVLDKSSVAAVLHYVAGRSAQFLGDYSTAVHHFQEYVSFHSGADDLAEVLFRQSLCYLRLGQSSSAIASLEKLLMQKNIGRYELSANYWLARSLQANNNVRALAVVDEILKDYPFSYYGLRLKMERDAGKMEWPTPLRLSKSLAAEYVLLPSQKKSFERAELLGKNGWTAEAGQEAAELPVPNEAGLKALLAQRLADLRVFPMAFRLINDAGDIDESLRVLDVVSVTLPQIFKEAIQDQAQKQKLSPYLVRSLIRQESAFDSRAMSSSSAYGLMQLIGPTAQEVAGELGLRGVAIPDDVYVPETNIQMGTYYIAKMIRQFGGNVPLGLAAYNAGPTRLQVFVDSRAEVSSQKTKASSNPWDEMWFDELPWSETSFYVKAILRNTIMYRLMEAAQSEKPEQRPVQFGTVLWSDLAQLENPAVGPEKHDFRASK